MGAKPFTEAGPFTGERPSTRERPFTRASFPRIQPLANFRKPNGTDEAKQLDQVRIRPDHAIRQLDCKIRNDGIRLSENRIAAAKKLCRHLVPSTWMRHDPIDAKKLVSRYRIALREGVQIGLSTFGIPATPLLLNAVPKRRSLRGIRRVQTQNAHLQFMHQLIGDRLA